MVSEKSKVSTLIIGNKLKELKELVEVVNHKIGKVETNQGIYSAQLVLIKAKQSVLNDKLDEVQKTQGEHTRRLEALAGDTEQLLTDVKGIRDEIGLWHQRDKREIDEIKVHIGLPIIPDAP